MEPIPYSSDCTFAQYYLLPELAGTFILAKLIPSERLMRKSECKMMRE
jgi:hypothetical protein